MTIVSGILTGLLIAVVCVWFWYIHNRLWRESIGEDLVEVLQAAAAMGLTVGPASYRAKWVARGTIDGVRVALHWRGGAFGMHTVVFRGRDRWLGAVVATPDALRDTMALISGEVDQLPVGLATGGAGEGVVSETAEHIGEPVGDALARVDTGDGDAGLGFLEEGLSVEE